MMSMIIETIKVGLHNTFTWAWWPYFLYISNIPLMSQRETKSFSSASNIHAHAVRCFRVEKISQTTSVFNKNYFQTLNCVWFHANQWNLSPFKNDLEILTCSGTFKIQDQFENIKANVNVSACTYPSVSQWCPYPIPKLPPPLFNVPLSKRI